MDIDIFTLTNASDIKTAPPILKERGVVVKRYKIRRGCDNCGKKRVMPGGGPPTRLTTHYYLYELGPGNRVCLTCASRVIMAQGAKS